MNNVNPDGGPVAGESEAESKNEADSKTPAEPFFPQIPETKTDEPTEFKTPDQAAATDDIAAVVPETETATEATLAEPKATTSTGWRARFALRWPPGNKEYIVAAVVLVLLAGIGSALALSHSAKPVVSSVAKHHVKKPKPAPAPTIVASTLSGLPVAPAINQRPVTAVMIENSLDARPQSGLSQAGVVFEAIAEGGVTRFMALYQDTAPDTIGPIRSARPYYVNWSLGFDAGYAHVGGSPDGLQAIKDLHVRDLDQFANGGSYHRIDTRDAPHNVYTAVQTLTDLQISKGYTTSNYSGFVRKVAAPNPTPNAKTIDLSLSGYYYNPHFDYNPATNSYNRSEAGAPQTDQNTGQQLAPNVVIALVTPLGQGELDASGAYYSNYTVIGSGAAYIFQDGIVTIGQWNKASPTAQITFTDAAGKPIGLNPGQTWLTAVSSAGGVTYAP
jgi:hypothetical protein